MRRPPFVAAPDAPAVSADLTVLAAEKEARAAELRERAVRYPRDARRSLGAADALTRQATALRLGAAMGVRHAVRGVS